MGSVIPETGFRLLALLDHRCLGRRFAPPEVLEAVAVLTAAADPARAERLRPRPGEPPALIARLAVWALRQVDDRTARAALEALLGGHARCRPDRRRATVTGAGADPGS